MLEVPSGSKLIEHVWDSLPEHAAAPEGEEKFLSKSGRAQSNFDDHRRYLREYSRARVVITAHGVSTGGYTNDRTHEGWGIISSRQLFPKDTVQVLLPSGERPAMTVCWCRRLGEKCYAVGCKFIEEE